MTRRQRYTAPLLLSYLADCMNEIFTIRGQARACMNFARLVNWPETHCNR